MSNFRETVWQKPDAGCPRLSGLKGGGVRNVHSVRRNKKSYLGIQVIRSDVAGISSLGIPEMGR